MVAVQLYASVHFHAWPYTRLIGCRVGQMVISFPICLHNRYIICRSGNIIQHHKMHNFCCTILRESREAKPNSQCDCRGHLWLTKMHTNNNFDIFIVESADKKCMIELTYKPISLHTPPLCEMFVPCRKWRSIICSLIIH